MKKHLLLLVLASSMTFLNAQCELENNSFEEWTVQILVSDSTANTEVLIADAVFPAVRFLFWGFTGNQELIDSISLADPIGFVGMEQSTDATDGSFAIKLQSKYSEHNELADIYYFDSCSEVPDSFAFDIKHVGVGEDDYMAIGAIFDQGLPSLFDDAEDSPYAGLAELDLTDDSPYTRYVVPIEENFESEVDSFYYIFAVETTDSTYFLVDNVEFIYKQPSSTSNTEILNSIELIQNPVYENLSIAIHEPINMPVDLIVTDIHGKTYMRKSYQAIHNNLEFDISDFPSGSYNLQLWSREGVSTFKFIKI